MSYCPFKEFKDLLGIPGEGVHSLRLLNTAAMDYIFTIILAIATSYFSDIPLVLTTIMWFMIGIILHILFGVSTNTTRYLGINCN